MEEWKNIDKSFYSVSSLGNIKNNNTNRLLKSKFDKDGYIYYHININNRQKAFRIHRLLGNYFIPNLNNLPLIDHINNIRNDNRLENLRWISYSNNVVNSLKCKNSSSIYKGVCYLKHRNRFQAYISVNKKQLRIGYFKNEIDAVKAYNQYVIDNNLIEFYKLNNIE
jgi:hypothetical protein